MNDNWIPIDKLPPDHRQDVLITLPHNKKVVVAKMWYADNEFPMGFTYYGIGGKKSIDFLEIKFWMPTPEPSPY